MDFPPGIRPNSTGTGLEIRIQYRGQRYSITYAPKNPYSARAIAAAVRKRADLKQRLRLGLPLLLHCENVTTALLADVANDYLSTLTIKFSTAQSYVHILNRHWLPPLCGWPIHEIKPSHIKKILIGLNLSPKTIRNIVVPLRCVFDHARADELIENNPCDAVKLPKRQKPVIQRFTVAEQQSIVNKLQGQSRVYFMLLFESGLRPSEALALEWTDYNGELLHVSKGIVRRRIEPTTKNYEVRDVIVSDRLKHELANHPTRFSHRHVFVNSHGGPYLDADTFNADWRNALKKARVPYRKPYLCRHTRAGMLLTAGVDPAFAAKQMGHSLEMFLRIYADLIDGMRDNEQAEKIKAIGRVTPKTA